MDFLRKSRKLIHLLGHPTYLRGARAGVAAAIEHTHALQNLRVRTVLDVGCNRGQFSLTCRRLFPDAIIVAFDPLPSACGKYNDLFGSDDRAECIETALGSETSQLLLNVTHKDDSSSLLTIGRSQSENFGTRVAGQRLVSTSTLESHLAKRELQPPILLKIDVQGWELEVLKGAPSAMKGIDLVYCEMSALELYEGQALADELIGWMREHAFVLLGMYNPRVSRKGAVLQFDALFARQGSRHAAGRNTRR